ncbi:MAG TPA: septum formation initiator family protein [Bryobacteraceae bacterium]|jgi:cell division protein FtsB|nr:septum formation initiator family protein [Bryobacteraceae bacterium]
MKISVVKAVYALIVLCGIAYAFVELRGPSGIPGLIEKRRQVHELEAGNEQLHREIEQKQERINRLQSDPREQEIEIRQRLKLASPGEKIYIIDDKKK